MIALQCKKDLGYILLPARAQPSHSFLVEVGVPFSLNTTICMHLSLDISLCLYFIHIEKNTHLYARFYTEMQNTHG